MTSRAPDASAALFAPQHIDGAYVFSRRTFSALAGLLGQFGHTKLDELFYRFALDDFDVDANTTKRAIGLVRAVEQGACAEGTAEEITIELLNEVSFRADAADEKQKRMSASLAADGFAFETTGIRPIVPIPVAAPLQASRIEAMLELIGADEALNHFRQALATFSDAQFEAASGQTRSALESFLKLAASASGDIPADSTAAIQKLRSSNRIDDKEQAFFKASWSLMHTGGAHAGKSSANESLLRITSASLVIWLLAERLVSDRAS